MRSGSAFMEMHIICSRNRCLQIPRLMQVQHIYYTLLSQPAYTDENTRDEGTGDALREWKFKEENEPTSMLTSLPQLITCVAKSLPDLFLKSP